MSVRVSYERARGCGRRKEGGLYLVAGQPSEPCSLLPVETAVCPCCGTGIKPARGWTWIDADPFLDAHYVARGGTVRSDDMVIRRGHGTEGHMLACPLARKLGRTGLIWVGEAFYKTPGEFMREANDMGISRRITAVPRDFVLGETWVLLAHRRAIPAGYKLKGQDEVYETLQALNEANPDADPEKVEDAFKPGIITAFMPTAIEYVTRPEDREDEEFLSSLEKRGITPVEVRPAHEPEEALPV